MYMNRIDAKSNARKNIKGNWTYLFFTVFLMALVSGLISGILTAINGAIDNKIAKAIFSVFSFAVSVVVYLAMMPLDIALSGKCLAVSRGGKTSDVDLFCYYKEKDYSEKIKASLFITLYVAIGCVLFLIPGIILALRYSVIGFVFADNPKIGYREALDKCKEITDGYKWELFVFFLSFIGWHLLACLTVGILEIWIIPYQSVAFASWYDIINPKKEEPSVDEQNIFEDFSI